MSGPSSRDDALQAAFDAGRAAYPTLALTSAAFRDWAADHLPEDVDPTKLAADNVLVAACVMGAPGAAKAFVDGPLREAEPSIARVLPDPAAREEALQDLAVHLLTPGPVDPDVPRLANYEGRAPLRAWVRMVATRRALRRARGQTRLVSFEAVAFDKAADHDPEISMLRRAHGAAIAAIFREAVASVGDEDRTLLRLHYVQGLTLAELAALHKTSRSSLHRRLESVRDVLFERIAALVRARLKLSDTQQGSMLRIFHSDLKDELSRLLKEG